jgi:hypothetical protein
MTDQYGAGNQTREGSTRQPQGFDKERMVLALIGLAGAAVIVAMNVG